MHVGGLWHGNPTSHLVSRESDLVRHNAATPREFTDPSSSQHPWPGLKGWWFAHQCGPTLTAPLTRSLLDKFESVTFHPIWMLKVRFPFYLTSVQQIDIVTQSYTSCIYHAASKLIPPITSVYVLRGNA